MNAHATQSSSTSSGCKRKRNKLFLLDKPKPVSCKHSSVCRVCLGTEVRMYHMAEQGLSDMYTRVLGVQMTDIEDQLPQMLCWECVGRLSSAHRFIQKALKVQRMLKNKINENGSVTISDTESIDRTVHKLESSLGTKLNIANDYDFHFTEETVESNNCCNTSKLVYNDSDLEHNANIKKEIIIKEEFMDQEELINAELDIVYIKQEASNNYDTVYKGMSEGDKEGYDDTENEGPANDFKQEYTGDDESFSEMSQEGTQVVDKSSEVAVVIKQSHNCLPLLVNQNSKIPPDSKQLTMLVDDNNFTTYNKDHSKQVIENAIQSTTRDSKKILGMATEHTQPVSNAAGSASLSQKNKSILSGTEYPQSLFICDICYKQFHHKRFLKLHIQKHPKIHYCTYCSYKTRERRIINEHINAVHTKSVSFPCPHCSYKAYLKSTLLRHVNIKHTKSEVFNCPHCDYKAYQKASLRRHVNAKHTKSEAFECPHCNYKANQKAHLLGHINAKHTQSEVFKCIHCDFKAFQKSGLKLHVNAIHFEKNILNCPHCSYKTHFKSTLSKHINSKHTKSESFYCSHCSYKTYRKDNLRTHVTNQHANVA